MRRKFCEADHEAYRELARTFVERAVKPNQERWEREHDTGRQVWKAAGAQGLIGLLVPERFGGQGITDYRYRSVLMEELARVGAASLGAGFALQDDIAIPYIADFGTDEQKSRWLPAMVAGESIGAAGPARAAGRRD
jgi:alkylation response protein AidB-like acyl-CoA dehydrogenase